MGLQLLLVFAQDGCRTSASVVAEIARYGDVLCRIVQDYPNDHSVTELAVVVLAHTARLVISSVLDAPHRRLDDLGLCRMVPTMLDIIRKPHPTSSLLTHALMSLVTPTQYIPAQCKNHHSLKTLLVALLRARNLTTRATALEGILNICQTEFEPEKLEIDLHRLAQNLKRAQPPLGLIGLTAEDYPSWLRHSESSQVYRQSVRYVEAMSQAARDHNLPALGRSIADIVQHSPLTVDGSWEELEQEILADGQHASFPLSPSLGWDNMPECARALRRTGTLADSDAAAILDMKHHMLYNRTQEAAALARQTSARNPEHLYAYYVLSLCGETSEGLRAAIRGLRCAGVTQFLRKQLLWRTVELSIRLGFGQILTAAIEDERAQQEGVALLRNAWRNAQTFLAEAPPDAHLRLTMLGWSMLLVFALRGQELSSHLGELDVCYS